MDSPPLRPLRPPPRSSAIKANLCKLLSAKSTRSSYALNPHKKLTKSRWSCSSLSTATSSSFDQPTNCSLTRLTEEQDTLHALHRLSLSKSSDLLSFPASDSVTLRQEAQPSRMPDGASEGMHVPVTCSSSAAAAAAKSGKVTLRERTGAKQPRPKSECVLQNPAVQIRNRKVVKSANRHSTIEVSRRPFAPAANRVRDSCHLDAGKESAVWSTGGLRASGSSWRRFLCNRLQRLQQVSCGSRIDACVMHFSSLVVLRAKLSP